MPVGDQAEQLQLTAGQIRYTGPAAFVGAADLDDVRPEQPAYAGRVYPDLSAVRSDVREARILSGLHFRHSMNDGDTLGTQVARWIAARH